MIEDSDSVYRVQNPYPRSGFRTGLESIDCIVFKILILSADLFASGSPNFVVVYFGYPDSFLGSDLEG
jgi:hypothetical protein